MNNILAINTAQRFAQYDTISPRRCIANISILANIGFGTVSAPFFSPFFTQFDPSDLSWVNFAWWFLSCCLKTWCKMPIMSTLTFLWKECDWRNSNAHAWSRKSAEMCPNAAKSAIFQYRYILPIDQYVNHEIIGNINMSWVQGILISIWAFRVPRYYNP